MTTQEKIKADMIAAMKAKEALVVEVLRGVSAAFTNELVAKGRKPSEPLPDEEALTVLKRLGKQRQDSAEQFTSGGRPELAEKEAKELAILKAYLPQMASRAEIEVVARAKMAEMGVTDKAKLGVLMGAILKEFKGTADGSDVKVVVESLFA